jgi:FkbM family methyltransferase
MGALWWQACHRAEKVFCMNMLTKALRAIAPLGWVERRRRILLMKRYGLSCSSETAEAFSTCRYDLWPTWLQKPVRPWLLVDVGANTGEFSAAVARLVALAGVHAFEPQIDCHAALSTVLAQIPNSHLHRAAVGAEAGEIELICTANSKLASVLSPMEEVADGYVKGDFHVQNRVKVPLVRLDDVLPGDSRIGLLKIDVQGFELPVLEGASKTLEATDALLMEINYVRHYQGGASFDHVYEVLRRRGFRVHGISAPYLGPAGPLWADALFVRE